jgi:hypothetical protein
VLPSLNFPQLDFVKPSSGFHPVTWERITTYLIVDNIIFIPMIVMEAVCGSMGVNQSSNYN